MSDNLNQDPTQPGFINLYTYFKVSQDATDTDIDKSFRKMSLAWHPDKNRTPEASSMFAKLSAWRDLLKDPETRVEYDQNLAWYNEQQKLRKPRPADSPPQSSRKSSFSSRSNHGSTRQESRTVRSARSEARTSSRYESRGPPESTRHEPRTHSEYDPNCPDCAPPRRSTSHRETRCDCPDCRPPSIPSQRRARTTPEFDIRAPRYETREPSDYTRRATRPQGRSRGDSYYRTRNLSPAPRSSTRRGGTCVIIIDDDSSEDEFHDRPQYDYETRSPVDRTPRYESRDPCDYGDCGSRPSGYRRSTHRGYDCY